MSAKKTDRGGMRKSTMVMQRISDVLKRTSMWLVRIDDMDCGPFTPDEVKERIRTGQVDDDTVICDERTREWKFLRDVPDFFKYFNNLDEIRKHEAEEHALDKQEASVRRGHKVQGSVGFIAIGGLFVAGAVTAIILATGTKAYPSNYTGSIFMTAELGRIERWETFSGDKQHEWRFGKEKSRKKRKRRSGSRSGSSRATDDVYHDTTDEPVALDFGASNTGRTLSNAEINSEVVPQVRRKISKCLQEEHSRRPAFSGATIQFALLPTGQTAAIRVMQAVSAKMHGCVKGKVKKIRVKPFAGGTRWVRVSLQIATE